MRTRKTEIEGNHNGIDFITKQSIGSLILFNLLCIIDLIFFIDYTSHVVLGVFVSVWGLMDVFLIALLYIYRKDENHKRIGLIIGGFLSILAWNLMTYFYLFLEQRIKEIT
ncbi:MAG: hypothetical protein JXB08_03875, partial [Bacilli bacterium]|nr:hypothetical protein [Bacilli bacterium]